MILNSRSPFRRMTRATAAVGAAAGLTLTGAGAAGASPLDALLAPGLGSSSELPAIADLLPGVPGLPQSDAGGAGGAAATDDDADRGRDATAERIEKAYEDAYSDQAAGYDRDAALDRVAESDLDAFLAGDRAGYERQREEGPEGSVTYVKKDADGRTHYIQELDRDLVDGVLAERNGGGDGAGRDGRSGGGAYGLAVRGHAGKYYVAVVMDSAKDGAAPADHAAGADGSPTDGTAPSGADGARGRGDRGARHGDAAGSPRSGDAAAPAAAAAPSA